MLFPLPYSNSPLLHDSIRRNRITKEDQFSTMPHHGRIPTHGDGGSKEAHHRYNQQHQLPRPPAMAPPRSSSDMLLPAEASLPSASAGDGGSTSSGSWVVKPGCMMELARLAKVAPPESGLMCPRCQSTETKFCYYNNYSLSQPRHLCRTCRRYWTHGGALRDLPFSSSARHRRRRGKPSSSNKHTASSKVSSGCASGTSRAPPSSSSSSSSTGATVPGGGVAVAAAIMQQALERSLAPVDMLGVGVVESHRIGGSRLWFPGHSSQQDHVPLGGYGHHQLASSRGGAANAIRLDHQHRYISCTEAGSFTGQMHAISCRVPGSAVLTTELSSAMMAAENTPIPSVTETMASSPGESDLFHFLGSSSSWACGGYGFTAGNGGSGGGRSCTVAAPGNLWPDTSSGFTSSSCARSTIL